MELMTKYSAFVLASSSPRRRELLGLSGLSFKIAPADVDETPLPNENAFEYVSRVAESKAKTVAHSARNGELVIAADTIVIMDDEILGKPKDAQEAKTMLEKLRNRNHQVATGLVLVDSNDMTQMSSLTITDVPMRNFSDAEMQAYIDSGDPLDKAGSYAIQNSAFHPVEQLQGCYANVVGLPLCHMTHLMKEIGITGLEEIPDRCQLHFGYECTVYEQALQGEL